MKTRLSHVTNSSSSSFVISRNDITKDKLIEILLEIANKEYNENWKKDHDEEIHYNLEEDVKEEIDTYEFYHSKNKMFEDRQRPKTVVAGRYIITEGTEEQPYWDWDDYEYTNDYIIDNESCVRYDWDIIEDVLGEYGIPWRSGYCD